MLLNLIMVDVVLALLLVVPYMVLVLSVLHAVVERGLIVKLRVEEPVL